MRDEGRLLRDNERKMEEIKPSKLGTEGTTSFLFGLRRSNLLSLHRHGLRWCIADKGRRQRWLGYPTIPTSSVWACLGVDKQAKQVVSQQLARNERTSCLCWYLMIRWESDCSHNRPTKVVGRA
jgi:hypothetical protein